MRPEVRHLRLLLSRAQVSLPRKRQLVQVGEPLRDASPKQGFNPHLWGRRVGSQCGGEGVMVVVTVMAEQERGSVGKRGR